MYKQKQIEEMANDLKKIKFDLKGCFVPQYVGVYEDITAKELHDLGYRKIPENAVVLNVSEYVRLKSIEENIDRVIKQKCKETAEKFAERAKEEAFVTFMGEPIIRASKIDEICMEIKEENDEKQKVDL